MSSWDLYEDGFPHGTTEGYRKGCRGGACPAGVEHGLSCRRANQMRAGDYQYGRLVAAGHTPAEIAAQLQLGPTTHEAPAKRTPAPHPDEDEDLTAENDLEEDTMPTITATPASVAKAAGKRKSPAGKRKSPAGPSQSAVREWAHANGINVNARGAVRRDVVDQYLAAQSTAPAPAEPDVYEALVEQAGTAVGEALDASLAEDRDPVSIADLANPYEDDGDDAAAAVVRTPDRTPSHPVEIAAAPHTVTDDIAEQLAQLNAHLEHLRDERDESQRALTFALRQWHEARTTAALNAIHLADARAAERTLLDALHSAEEDLAASRALADHYRAEAEAAGAHAARPWWKRHAS